MTQGQGGMHIPTEGDRVAGKVAIVTGGGSVAEGIGNGRAAAILLARHGARVVLMDRVRSAAEDTAAMIAKNGGACPVVEGDVTRPDDCEAAVQRTIEAGGVWTSWSTMSAPAGSGGRRRTWIWTSGTWACAST